MIRRLIILLLIVGCDNNSTGSNINPIVGIWEWVSTTNTIQDYHQGSNSETITNNDIIVTYTFNQDGTYNYGEMEGTWTTNSNTLILLSNGDSNEYDYSINNNTLLISYTSTIEIYCSACQSWHPEIIIIILIMFGLFILLIRYFIINMIEKSMEKN